MTLEELHALQQRELEDYRATQTKSWEDMTNGHKQIFEAIGGEQNLSQDTRKQMDAQIDNYRKEWSMYTGERHKALTEKHKKEREAITGKAKFTEPAKALQKGDPLSDDQQAKLQKIIAQQQAIRQRSEEKKHKR